MTRKQFIGALFGMNVEIMSILRIRPLIDFTEHSPNILASIRILILDQTDHLALVPSTFREEENMNLDAAEFVDVALVEEVVKNLAVAEAEDKFIIPVHYLVHMVMELLVLKLRYMNIF